MLTMATSEMSRIAYRSVESAESTNDMAAAKESGAIEYGARVMVALRNAKDHGDLIQARVVKNKHGSSWPREEGEFYLRIDRLAQQLSDAEAPKSAPKPQKANADVENVFRVILNNPGIGTRKLRAKSGLGDTSLDRALYALMDAERVENRPSQHGERTDPHYFPLVGSSEEAAQ